MQKFPSGTRIRVTSDDFTHFKGKVGFIQRAITKQEAAKQNLSPDAYLINFTPEYRPHYDIGPFIAPNEFEVVTN